MRLLVKENNFLTLCAGLFEVADVLLEGLGLLGAA